MFILIVYSVLLSFGISDSYMSPPRIRNSPFSSGAGAEKISQSAARSVKFPENQRQNSAFDPPGGNFDDPKAAVAKSDRKNWRGSTSRKSRQYG